MISKILKTVPTYKDRESLQKIGEVASKLKPHSKVLILGPGQGAETIVIKKLCATCSIVAVDKWNYWKDDGYLNIYTANNNRQNYIENCRKFDVEVDRVYDDDVFKSGIIDELDGDWDLIYYDCRDNLNGEEFDIITELLNRLWGMLNDGGYLIGDDYFIDRPDFKMTPIVESFFYESSDSTYFNFNNTGDSLYWIIRKNG